MVRMIKLMTSVGMVTAAGKEISSIIHGRRSPYQPIKPLVTPSINTREKLRRKSTVFTPNTSKKPPKKIKLDTNEPIYTNNPCTKQLCKNSQRWEHLYNRFASLWDTCKHQLLALYVPKNRPHWLGRYLLVWFDWSWTACPWSLINKYLKWRWQVVASYRTL